MAGVPPGPPGAPPGLAGLLGGPPGGPGPNVAPPLGLVPGAPPGMPGLPPPAFPTPPLGAMPITDLSASMPPQWQLVDMATRYLRNALATGEFRKTPGVHASIREIESNLVRLISAYSAGGKDLPQSAPADTERGAPVGDSDGLTAQVADSPQPE